MRVPLSWMREFNDCELPPEEIAKRMTLGGLEVESTQRIGVYSREVRVAEILETRSHPRADTLRVVDLDVGGGVQATAITGAPNITAGMKGVKVPAALPGAILIDATAEDFELSTVETRSLMGVESNVVLASAMELGIVDDHSGVWIVDDKACHGDFLFDHVKPLPGSEADVVFEVAILPNYGRCLSIIGMAREVAALTRTSFRLSLSLEQLTSDDEAFDIQIADPDLCSRYSGLVIEGVNVKRSPRWMQRRLVLTGHKPINNLVDVTNYVMTEMGQPMHAFDLERLPARNITVRRARAGETIYTLDQKIPGTEEGESAGEPPRELTDSILLITSGDRPVAVAGVIGGLESQIYAETRNILLESANFDAVAIRKATSALKVSTESSYRFSREVDPALTTLAIQRAAGLLREIADAEPAGAICDKYPGKKENLALRMSRREICRSLGMELEREEIHSALRRLGFQSEDAPTDDEAIDIEVPSYRPDVTIGADIAEEVVRVVGFDRLELRYLEEPLPKQRRNLSWEIRRRMRQILAGCGLQDVINYSLTTPDSEKLLRAAEHPVGELPYVEILNPTSQERSAMRRTLLSGLMEMIVRNHRQRERIALFEIGLVWHPEHGDGTLPAEIHHLGIVRSGPVEEPSWNESRPPDAGFFDLKGIVEGLLRYFHVDEYSFSRTSEPPFHPGIAAELLIRGRSAGHLGQVHPAVLEAYDLERRTVVAAELDLRPWLEANRSQFPFRSFSRFPPVRQDLALVVDDDVAAGDVLGAIRETAGPLLTDIRLFDVYRGKQLQDGKKSLAFELTFCAEDRSLLEEEVNQIRDEILPVLEEKLGARLR